MSTLRQQVSNCPYAAIYGLKQRWRSSGRKITFQEFKFIFWGCCMSLDSARSVHLVPIIISRKQSRFFPESTPAIRRPTLQVAPAPISLRFLCPCSPLLLSTPNQNCHTTQANVLRALSCLSSPEGKHHFLNLSLNITNVHSLSSFATYKCAKSNNVWRHWVRSKVVFEFLAVWLP